MALVRAGHHALALAALLGWGWLWFSGAVPGWDWVTVALWLVTASALVAVVTGAVVARPALLGLGGWGLLLVSVPLIFGGIGLITGLLAGLVLPLSRHRCDRPEAAGWMTPLATAVGFAGAWVLVTLFPGVLIEPASVQHELGLLLGLVLLACAVIGWWPDRPLGT